jgi:hypothetical protein
MLGLQRGLKNWAKKPATTSQKGRCFEGQCARIREKSMIDHAHQMDSD